MIITTANMNALGINTKIFIAAASTTPHKPDTFFGQFAYPTYSTACLNVEHCVNVFSKLRNPLHSLT